MLGILYSYSTKPHRPTQPGHPSKSRQNEYWQWLCPCTAREETMSYA